ncbi:MAG: type II toxin-antitoxin system RelE/ParE family toxin [Methanoregulaceae archaeon]
MTCRIVAGPGIEETFRKLRKKDPARFEQIGKKLRELGDNPDIGKPLHRPLQGLRRIHIGHFVLVYKFETKKEQIILVDFSHHDQVY